MKRNLITLLILFLMTFAFMAFNSSEANAQRRSRNRVAKAQVDRIISNLENRVDAFVGQFNKSLDRSRLNGTKREDRLNERARDLENATDELRDEFDQKDAWAESRDEVRKCLNVASGIDAVMRNRRLDAATESNWAAVRSELNTLARIYGFAQLGRNYR